MDLQLVIYTDMDAKNVILFEAIKFLETQNFCKECSLSVCQRFLGKESLQMDHSEFPNGGYAF